MDRQNKRLIAIIGVAITLGTIGGSLGASYMLIRSVTDLGENARAIGAPGSSGLFVIQQAYGHIEDGRLHRLEQVVGLGSEDVFLALIEIELTNLPGDATFVHDPGIAQNMSAFSITAVRDADDSLAGQNPVLNDDDLAHIVLDLGATGLAPELGHPFDQVQVTADGQHRLSHFMTRGASVGSLVVLEVVDG